MRYGMHEVEKSTQFKITGSTVYVHKATFVGTRRFPIDMLRYDNCRPASESDSSRINASFRVFVPDDVPIESVTIEPVTVTKLSTHKDFEAAFNVARWESFGWLPVTEETLGMIETLKGGVK